jgi:hypothetical protein
MRNGLQLLVRHSLQPTTLPALEQIRNRAIRTMMLSQSESRGSPNTATAWQTDLALNEPSRRNRLSDLSVVHRRTLLISLPTLIL